MIGARCNSKRSATQGNIRGYQQHLSLYIILHHHQHHTRIRSRLYYLILLQIDLDLCREELYYLLDNSILYEYTRYRYCILCIWASLLPHNYHLQWCSGQCTRTPLCPQCTGAVALCVGSNPFCRSPASLGIWVFGCQCSWCLEKRVFRRETRCPACCPPLCTPCLVLCMNVVYSLYIHHIYIYIYHIYNTQYI
jgi:hypothetical protein